jgi:DNA-binding NarL/FixJ family response regulator
VFVHTYDTGRKAKILIVDDHPIVRQGMAQLINLQKDLHLCCEAEDADQAMAAMRACHHDLAIVDISLPGVSGFELIKTLTSHYDNLMILVVSMHGDPSYAERALRAGARGYIMKQEATQSILFALRQLLKGGLYLSGDMQARILDQMIESPIHAERSPVNRLSEREFEVLRLIGLGFGTAEIADKLSRSVKTIETHRASIKAKFGLKTSSQLVKFAVRWISRES